MTRVGRLAAAILVVVALAVALGGLAVACLAGRPALAEPVSYFALAPGRPVRFAVNPSDPVHVGIRVLGSEDGARPDRYELEVRLLARDGSVVSTRTVARPIPAPSSQDDTIIASSVTVTPPATCAWLELAATSSRLAVRVTRPIERRAAVEGYLPHTGVDLRWLGPERSSALVVHRHEALPAFGVVPVVPLAQVAAPAHELVRAPAPAGMAATVGLRHHAVYNLVGPGRARVAVAGTGQFDVTSLGSVVRRSVMDANAERAIELPAGVSSVVLAARGTAHGTPAVRLEGVRDLDHEPSPSPPPATGARTPAIWLAPGATLEFSVRGAFPLRVGARGIGGARGALEIELRDAQGARLAPTHSLDVAPTPDPFVVVERSGARAPLGQETSLIVLPPRGARTLRVIARTDVIVAVQVAIEDGSDPSPRAPYSTAPPGLTFVGAPAMAPRWFPPTFATPASYDPGWKLVRSPHLEPVRATAAAPTAPAMAQVLLPALGPEVELHEPARAGSRGDAAVVATGAPTRLTVAGDGPRAGALRMICQAYGELGGDVRVRVDGADAQGPVRLLVERVVLDVAVDPGEHLIEIAGAPVTCVAHARGAQVAHHAVPVDLRSGIQIEVDSAPSPSFVSCALYAPQATDADVAVTVDGGEPARRTGRILQLTRGRRTKHVVFAEDATMAATGAAVKRATLYVPLGDDLAPGRHRIAIRSAAASPRWARCWMPAPQHHNEQVTTWSTAEH